MANEITLSARIEAVKGNLNHKIAPGTLQFTMAGNAAGAPGVVAMTTAAAAISFAPVVPGYVYFRNLSTGATVRLQTTGAEPFSDIPAGRIGIIPKSTHGWSGRCTTAGGTADLDIRGFDT